MDIWRRIGFSEGEGRVYEAIMDSENASLQTIHEKTGLERRNVYDIINKLISKGLVTYFTDNKRKIYQASHPKNILTYFDEQQKEIERKKGAFATEMEVLSKRFDSSKPTFDVRIYRGQGSLRTLFNEMLDYPDIYFIGGNWGMVKYLGKEWVDGWMERRNRKKAWMHDIITAKPKLLARYAPHMKFYEVRILPEEFGSPNVINIFGNRLVNLFWGENLFAFSIENEEIAKNYVVYFKYLWKTLGQGK